MRITDFSDFQQRALGGDGEIGLRARDNLSGDLLGRLHLGQGPSLVSLEQDASTSLLSQFCPCPGCVAAKIQYNATTVSNPDPGSNPTSAVSADSFDTGGGPQFLGDDIADDITTTTSISVGGTLNSSIQTSGDLDYISISLVAGHAYTFSLDFAGTGFGSDGYLELRDSTGALVAQNDDGGIDLDSFLMYSATQTGTFYIVARGFDGGTTGSYTLTTDEIVTGQTSPTTFTSNGLPYFSWEEAAIQITRTGQSWATAFNTPTVVTYAYRASAPATMPDDTAGFSTFSNAQIAATEAALAAWASVANITFVRADDGGGYSNNATILFGNYSSGADGAAAFAYLPTSNPVGGDVWVNITLSDNSNITPGGYGNQVLLHEIGHALGLSHPGDYNAGEGNPTYPGSSVFYGDTRMFTIMSYFASIDTGGAYSNYASLPQVFDIAAIQRLYGANTSTRTGDTVYGFNSNTGIAEFTLTNSASQALFAIWDGAGNDTLDLSLYTTSSLIDLREEAFSSAGPRTGGTLFAVFNISIAHGVVIENAIGGTGDDTIIGNSANNVLDGRAGFDVMSGGLGDDTYYGNSQDTITEDLNAGVDTFVSSGNATLTDNVENLTLTGAATTGTGNILDNVITGNDNNNTLNGAAGNDTLIGGIGADTMNGGADNDTYYVDDAGDAVSEALNQGTDTVHSALSSYTLNANVEVLILDGGALNGTGNALDNSIIGNVGNNILNGADGNDSLDGLTGTDTLIGGLGDDTYYVDNGGDVVTENASEGTDTIHSTVGVAALAANVENLVLLGTGVTGNGNGLNNIITGNASNNSINGGAGADTMIGGLGNDTYFVDNASDVITELSSQGTDTVFSTVNVAALWQNVENLTLSATALSVNGNFLNNVLTGNAQKNTLNGGSGEDTLSGGLDSDTYIYNSSGDVIVENLNEGANDAVIAFIDVSALMANVENVTLAGTATSATGNNLNNILTGNALGNFLFGGLGNDQLNGAVGADTMTGGQGDDTYLVENLGDVVIEASGEGNDVIYTWVNIAALTDNVERATIIGPGDLNITGNELANRLNGNDNNNALSGLDGDDIIGGLGGNDVITGGAGRDLLTGGAGNDSFVYQALSDSGTTGATRDIIYDFTQGQDLINLSAIDAITGGGDDSFNFIGNSAFTNTAGELRYETSGGYTIISMDVNGDGIADSQITLVGNVPLTSADFGL